MKKTINDLYTEHLLSKFIVKATRVDLTKAQAVKKRFWYNPTPEQRQEIERRRGQHEIARYRRRMQGVSIVMRNHMQTQLLMMAGRLGVTVKELPKAYFTLIKK